MVGNMMRPKGNQELQAENKNELIKNHISTKFLVSLTSPVDSSITALAFCKKSCPIKFFLPPVTHKGNLQPSISTIAPYTGFFSLYSPADITPTSPALTA